MIRALPPPSYFNHPQLVVVRTRDLIGWFREKAAQFTHASYDFDEIGHAFVESWHNADLQDPSVMVRRRQEFAEHFAAAHPDDEERGRAVRLYSDLFDRLCVLVEEAVAEELKNKFHYTSTFHHWLGDDLVLMFQSVAR